MLRPYTHFFIGFCQIICFLGAVPVLSQTLEHDVLLGRPTADRITIKLSFIQAADVCARYGLSPDALTQQSPWQSFAAGQVAEITLSNLSTDTRYYYQVCHRLQGTNDVATRPISTFHTARTPGSTFSFTVQADPHLDNQSDTALYRLCLKNQLADNPDFMIDLGDILMSDKLKNSSGVITRDTVLYRIHLLRRYYEQIGHSVPLFIALGNHEGEAGWQLNQTGQNVAVYSTQERKKYFSNPAPDNFYSGDLTQHAFVGQRENYYAWHWGDALFVVLDPYWYTSPKPDSLHGWRWTLGKTQYDWLKQTLESSDAPFKFVFSHQLVGGDPDGRGGVEFADLYEWGGKNLDGTDGWQTNRPGWYKPIKDLLTENKVSIFFHGHDHFFGQQQKDCLVYQETPQPSHPNFQNAGQADDYGYLEGKILPNSGHLRVTVSPDGVKTEYVRAYLPQNENPQRHNRDVSASYYISEGGCYDSLSTAAPVVWNALYADEIAYPNPFSDAVTISFSIEKAALVSLDIFDRQGKMVRRLLQELPIEAGVFQVLWDGRDAAGSSLPAGAYWYTLSSREGSVTGGKLLLIRS